MQSRETPNAHSALERLLARSDDIALDYVTDRLLSETPLDPEAVPSASASADETEVMVEG